MEEYEEINAKELFEKLQEDSVILIDVREEEEFNIRHIEGAINIPLSVFNSKKILNTKKNDIVFQCLSGKRSAMACDIFFKEGNAEKVNKVYNLKGGIKSWVAYGFDTSIF